MEDNNTVEVQLFDAVGLKTYTLYLSQDDATKCGEDEAFAQSLLFHAKAINATKKNNCHGLHGYMSEADAVSELDAASEMQQESQETENEKTNTGNNWSVNEAHALITAYETFSTEFEHAKKRKHVWQNISNQLLSLGIVRSAEKCEMKWRNLLRTYKSVKDNKTATGRGVTRFLFFERMDDILGSKPSVSCNHTFNSSLESGDNNKGDGTAEMKINDDGTNNNCENESTETDMSEKNDPQQPSKRQKKNHLNELRKLKINYFKRNEEGRVAKENRKEERIEMQKKLIQLEERKVALLERYFNGT